MAGKRTDCLAKSITRRHRSLEEAQEWVGGLEERYLVVYVSYAESRSYPGGIEATVTYVKKSDQ